MEDDLYRVDRLLVQIDARLRLFHTRVADHAQAIAQVDASLTEAERRPRRPAIKQRIGTGFHAALLPVTLYRWLAVVTAWMVAVGEALRLPR